MHAQEVSIMRKVRHKNVVQFIGACTRKPNLCIVFEFMTGGSVYDYIRRVGAALLDGWLPAHGSAAGCVLTAWLPAACSVASRTAWGSACTQATNPDQRCSARLRALLLLHPPLAPPLLLPRALAPTAGLHITTGGGGGWSGRREREGAGMVCRVGWGVGRTPSCLALAEGSAPVRLCAAAAVQRQHPHPHPSLPTQPPHPVLLSVCACVSACMRACVRVKGMCASV